MIWLLFKDNLALHPNLMSFESRKANIITDIISNYLNSYFSQRHVFLSVALSSVKVEHKFEQENLISELVTNPKLSNFTYIISNKVDQSRTGNRKVFNLIFIDESDALV